MQFESFDLDPRVVSALQKVGYVEPTEIQQLAIPHALQGRDVMGLAQTGTGKTAAFALPLLQRLLTKPGPRGRVQALILAPTRELADQIREEVASLGQNTGLRSLTVYGGVNINPQIGALRGSVEIVVACPGRLLDHIGRKTIDLSNVTTLVIDEADRMFDMGFLPDVRRILQRLPGRRQTMLFSATMPAEVRRLSREALRDAETVQAGHLAPAATVSHALYPVPAHRKGHLLRELIQSTDTESVIIFTRTKHRAKKVAKQLEKDGCSATCLQGNLSQNQRQKAIEGFRCGRFSILVATDIASRGIDVSQISHVINFDIPDTVEAYTHRIGRTGRVARTGDAFTLVTSEDDVMVRAIERVLGKRIDRRTIDGFDYKAPPPASTGSNRPRQQHHRSRRPSAIAS